MAKKAQYALLLMKRSPLILLSLLLAACAAEDSYVLDDKERPTVDAMETSSQSSIPSAPRSSANEARSAPSTPVITPSAASSANNTPPVPVEIPPSITLAVPFASQAPKGDWGDPYQEACEEASLILVKHFLEGTGVNADVMDREILDIVAWETENGYGQDVTINELAVVAQQYYGLQAEVIEGGDVTIDRIKRELALGNPVIVPLAGRELGNPYYSGEGPWYHMLVITGYDSRNFVTNDVGTRQGASYKYSYDVLFDAIHDWTGVKEEIRNGTKRMMTVRR